MYTIIATSVSIVKDDKGNATHMIYRHDDGHSVTVKCEEVTVDELSELVGGKINLKV